MIEISIQNQIQHKEKITINNKQREKTFKGTSAYFWGNFASWLEDLGSWATNQFLIAWENHQSCHWFHSKVHPHWFGIH